MKQQNKKQYAELSSKECKDLKILCLFTGTYCFDHHGEEVGYLSGLPESLSALKKYSCCEECRTFLHYAIDRRLKCPLSPKPSCKHCPVHCYRPEYREKAREIMRYSGKALICRGRIDLLWHYLF